MPRTHAAFFKMLATRTRVQILKLLRQYDDLTVDDLATRLGVTVPTVSRHLQLLRMQNLVTYKQEGQTRYYEVNAPEIADAIAVFLHELGIELPDKAGGR